MSKIEKLLYLVLFINVFMFSVNVSYVARQKNKPVLAACVKAVDWLPIDFVAPQAKVTLF